MSANDSGNGWEILAKVALQSAGIYAKSQENVTPVEKLPAKKVIRVDLLIPPKQIIKFSDGLAISVKGQSVGGSADEKLWYHLDRVIPAHPCPVLLVMPGSGWHKDWIEEARKKVDGIHFIDVLTSIDDLYEWAIEMTKAGVSAEYAMFQMMTNGESP